MGLLFKDDPEADAKKAAKKEAKEAAKAAKAEVKPQPTISSIVTPQTVTGMAGVVDEQFLKILWQAITDNNIPSQDYFEFKQAIDAMANLPLDERNKFLTTYTIFSAQGCKKETLLSSIDTYIKVIQREQQGFTKEFESQRVAKVQSKINEVESAKSKLDELNKQITELNAFILTASQEAQQADLQLQMTLTNFNKSAERVLQTLTSDKDKINSYIA